MTTQLSPRCAACRRPFDDYCEALIVVNVAEPKLAYLIHRPSVNPHCFDITGPREHERIALAAPQPTPARSALANKYHPLPTTRPPAYENAGISRPDPSDQRSSTPLQPPPARRVDTWPRATQASADDPGGATR